MTLLDHFRRRHRWENDDPAVRAEAVREIPSAEQDLLARLSRQDADSRVRRAALKRIAAPAILAEAARSDPDASVREEAVACLVEIAQGHDEGAAQQALAGIDEARLLAGIARGSSLASVRLGALSRIQDERVLATLAKLSDDPAVRRDAFARLREDALVADVALKGEHKDVAMAAADRVLDLAVLETIALRGRNGGASRRARARLEALRPRPEAVEPQAPPPPEATPVVTPPDPPPPPVVEAPAPPTPAPAPAPAPPAEHAADAQAGRVAREKEPRERVARVEALLTRLESLAKAEALTLRDADLALRHAREARADLDHVPARLAQKVKAARAALFAKTQPLREAEDWTRWSNAAIQEQLCERMEALVTREDHEKVARELHECDERWAAARNAPKEEDQALRQRYQAARSQAKAKLDAYFAKKAATEAENLALKEALCQKAESLAGSTEWVRVADELKALQARWKEIGPVPHRVSEKVWRRFRTACDRFFTRRQDDLKQRKEEWSKNLAKKSALCERAEALAGSSDWDPAAAEIKKLQAEWKAVGAVKKNRSEEVWQRFRKACDAFFERYKRRDEIAAGALRAQREAICAEIEALAPASPGAAPPEGLAERVLASQARARQLPPLGAADEQALTRRFVEARNTLVAAWPEAFRGTDLDPEMARTRKEKLLARVEALAAQADDGKTQGPLTGEDLARRLKEALASNTMGGAAEAESRRRAEAEEVEAARAAWKRLGPVPGDTGAALEQRFQQACARFQAGRPRPPRSRSSRMGAGIG